LLGRTHYDPEVHRGSSVSGKAVMARFVFVAVLLATAPFAQGAVVVIGNATGQEVQFSVTTHPTAKPIEAAIVPGESRAFTVGRQPELAFLADGKPDRYRLEPYSAYVFAIAKESLVFQGIALGGPMPKTDNLPLEPPASQPIRLNVKLLIDDADSRTKPVAEKALTQRIADASAILERQIGVTLTVTSFEDWASNPAAGDLHELLRDFETKTKNVPGAVLLGFTSRLNKAIEPKEGKSGSVGCTRGPLHTHVLMKEGVPRTEPERVEVLVHEIAHLFGAAHSPDRLSVMRPSLGDGLARNAKFKIALDPLNLLAANIWTEEMRAGPVKKWSDLKPVARTRLKVIYKTIAHVLPDDPVAQDYVDALDRVDGIEVAPRDPGVEVVGKDPVPTKPTSELTPKQDAIRKIVRAVTIRAQDLRTQTGTDGEKVKADALTAEYVKAAADVAWTLEEEHRVSAFLIGLGIALDDSTILRDNLVTRSLCRAVESDKERQERIAVLGVPTVHYRRDLCQHFVVSIALAELVGPAAAEAAGLAKELIDLDRSSGFSFADLAADLAGISFAAKVKKDPKLLLKMRQSFAVSDFVPSVDGLRDGISVKRFEQDFGSSSDPKFLKSIEEVRKRVDDLPQSR